MPGAEQRARRAATSAAGARWQVMLRRAYLALAQTRTPQYASVQCRLHWKTWSSCR